MKPRIQCVLAQWNPGSSAFSPRIQAAVRAAPGWSLAAPVPARLADRRRHRGVHDLRIADPRDDRLRQPGRAVYADPRRSHRAAPARLSGRPSARLDAGRRSRRYRVFADLSRHRGIVPVPGVPIVRPDAPLFYANAEMVRDAIENAVVSSAEPVRAVVLVLDGTTTSTSPAPSSSASWPAAWPPGTSRSAWPTCTAPPWRWPNGLGCSPGSAPITSSRLRPPPWPGRSR